MQQINAGDEQKIANFNENPIKPCKKLERKAFHKTDKYVMKNIDSNTIETLERYFVYDNYLGSTKICKITIKT